MNIYHLFSIGFLSLIFFISGCGNEPKATTIGDTIRVGTIAGPETELMETVKEVAKKKYDLNIKIIKFNEYNMPNVALNDHSIDANAFQHQPFLEQTTLKTSFDLIPLGKTFIYPIAAYSKKYKSLIDLPSGAVIAIPNNPSDQARALLLLEKAGLITLQHNINVLVTPMDIVQNPKKFIIKPMDASLLTLALPDVALAVINTNYALSTHLLPQKDGLIVEGPDSLYANIIAIRGEDKDNPKLKALVAAYQSPEVIAKAEELFQGQAIPAWIEKK